MAMSQPAAAPLSDHRGARRGKIGTSGRLHLDRSLPFLVLHRRDSDEDPSASIARRVALNSPAYLVWDAGPDDAAALELLAELTEELGRSGMPLLVIALDDLTQPPEGEAAPTSPRSSRPSRAAGLPAKIAPAMSLSTRSKR